VQSEKNVRFCFASQPGMAVVVVPTSVQPGSRANSGGGEYRRVWSLLFADDFEHGTADWLLNGDWSLQADDGNQVLHGVGYAFA
jgi:hypothetical protein